MGNFPPQPANRSYFFRKGYVDLYKTIEDCWKMNCQSAKRYWQMTKDFMTRGRGWIVVSVITAFAAFSVIFFGALWVVSLSTLHIFVLGSFFLLIYTCFTVLWILERVYMLMRGIFTTCPVCHTKSQLPHYLCPKCKAVHTRLIPSSYGILRRKCLCGNLLPTTFFQRRILLKDYARCSNPECSRSIEAGETKPICIPIVGGPAVGKTCFLFSAVRTLIDDIAPHKSWKIRFLNNQNEKAYNGINDMFDSGKVPSKTVEFLPVAFNFFIESEHWLPEKLLYFYDAAGEAFQRSENLSTHKFYDYLHGLIFVVDPFSIPEIFNRYEKQLKVHLSAIRPSEMTLDDTFDAILINLERNYGLLREKAIDKPCAVVITKVDAFELEDEIGETAAKDLFRSQQSLGSLDEAMDHNCRTRFHEWGLGNFLRKLDTKFSKSRFFVCSSLGRSPDGDSSPFQPVRSIAPLRWILSEVDGDLRSDLRQ
jgi:hypothetical protein